ncbi:hypothetical protein AB0E63_36655 [Kribbella sp. NPDC026596]|uniref:hypothetical protein n=1 Tax=Kribbella sp. NPDC026596 TaxID=3155122 RepID=UPI0034011A88
MAASPSGPRGGHPDEGEDSDNDGDHGGGNTMISCTNSALVRHAWATAVSEAAGDDSTHLDAALTLLTTIRDGLVKTRPQSPSHHPPA